MKKLLRSLGLVTVLLSLVSCGGNDTLDIYGIISGKVTDVSTGEPLNAAQVTLIPGSSTIQTTSDGTFSFAGLDEGFDDDAVFRKDDVAVFAHEFDVDFAGHQAAGDVQDIDVDVDEAVQVELADGGDAAVFIVFAQEHAQSCRGVRRRRHGLGYIEARCVVEGDDQVVDAFVVEDAEIQGPGVELVNFGYGTSLKEGDEFVCDAMQGNTV